MDTPVLVPADGTTRFPTISLSERPRDPVEEMERRGTSLMAYFRLKNPPITGFSARLHRLDRRGSAEEVPVLVAPPDVQRGVFGVVPESTLAANSRYRAVFTYRRGEIEESRTIELEEKDGFFRFERPRLYGRN